MVACFSSRSSVSTLGPTLNAPANPTRDSSPPICCFDPCVAVRQLRTRLQPSDLEETEAAVTFVAGLMSFSAQWRRRHRHSYDTLLVSRIRTDLIRTRLT